MIITPGMRMTRGVYAVKATGSRTRLGVCPRFWEDQGELAPRPAVLCVREFGAHPYGLSVRPS